MRSWVVVEGKGGRRAEPLWGWCAPFDDGRPGFESITWFEAGGLAPAAADVEPTIIGHLFTYTVDDLEAVVGDDGGSVTLVRRT